MYPAGGKLNKRRNLTICCRFCTRSCRNWTSSYRCRSAEGWPARPAPVRARAHPPGCSGHRWLVRICWSGATVPGCYPVVLLALLSLKVRSVVWIGGWSSNRPVGRPPVDSEKQTWINSSVWANRRMRKALTVDSWWARFRNDEVKAIH